MGSAAPLAVGTRGTVGSLVRREIDYFKRIDLERDPNASYLQDSKAFSNISVPCSNITSLGNFFMMSWKKNRKKKKKRSDNSGGSFLPSLCSAVEITEVKGFDGIPGFSYRTIRPDLENL